MQFIKAQNRVTQIMAVVCLMVVATAVGVWTGCKAAPLTGRRQLMVVPEKHEISSGISAYTQILADETEVKEASMSDMVKRVGERLAAVAGRPDYQWEFKLLKSEQMNAFALPGGKVAIYEGILPVCKNEAGLAVVMSHEVAHALARHGGERMSQTMLAKGGKMGLEFMTGNRTAQEKETWLKAYGYVSEYGVLLPYSRKHESEADHIGLMLMARAGYDPSEAPRFWQRFSEHKGGDKPVEFMSTHPSDERRSADLENVLPEAMELYEQAAVKHGFGETITTAGRP